MKDLLCLDLQSIRKELPSTAWSCKADLDKEVLADPRLSQSSGGLEANKALRPAIVSSRGSRFIACSHGSIEACPLGVGVLSREQWP